MKLFIRIRAAVVNGLRELQANKVRSLLSMSGIILGVAQGLGRQMNPPWGELAGHAVFLAVLVVRPTGLFGKGQLR